jgi:hypothetical protein
MKKMEYNYSFMIENMPIRDIFVCLLNIFRVISGTFAPWNYLTMYIRTIVTDRLKVSWTVSKQKTYINFRKIIRQWRQETKNAFEIIFSKTTCIFVFYTVFHFFVPSAFSPFCGRPHFILLSVHPYLNRFKPFGSTLE